MGCPTFGRGRSGATDAEILFRQRKPAHLTISHRYDTNKAEFTPGAYFGWIEWRRNARSSAPVRQSDGSSVGIQPAAQHCGQIEQRERVPVGEAFKGCWPHCRATAFDAGRHRDCSLQATGRRHQRFVDFVSGTTSASRQAAELLAQDWRAGSHFQRAVLQQRRLCLNVAGICHM
jgi:hypothetical protein